MSSSVLTEKIFSVMSSYSVIPGFQTAGRIDIKNQIYGLVKEDTRLNCRLA